MEPLLVTPEVPFDMLNIKHAKGYQMIKSGELPSIKIGRSRRVPLARLRAWVDELVAAQCSDASTPDIEAPDASDGHA